jgi:hypothetical protein
MSPRFAPWKSLLLAGLALGFCPLAQAQKAAPAPVVHPRPAVDPGQPIVFSSPDGQVVSNVPLPAVQAPQPQESPSFSDQSVVSIFNQQLPVETLPSPMPIVVPHDNGLLLNSTDPRKPLSLMTSSQIMKVPSMEKIFGLPERDSSGQTNYWFAQNQNQNQTTNVYASGETTFDARAWQKIMDGKTDAGATNGNDGGIFGSSLAKNSPGVLSAIFNTSPDDSLFGNQDKKNDPTVFDQIQAAATVPQSPLDSSLMGAMASAPAAAPATSPLDSPFNSQSPFALPKSSLQTMPQLPTLPVAAGQNYNSTPPPAAPSWEPKPAPWLSPVPPLGTMAQRKF